jgi:hypothetical protein
VSATHVVVVRVARDGITRTLRRRLVALGLDGRRERVGSALDLVTEVLGGGLLRVGLEGGTGLVGEALATTGGEEEERSARSLINFECGNNSRLRHDEI